MRAVHRGFAFVHVLKWRYIYLFIYLANKKCFYSKQSNSFYNSQDYIVFSSTYFSVTVTQEELQ